MRALLLLAVLIPALATAQTPGTCALGTAEATLSTADLSATLFTTGALFFGNTTLNGDGYEVPAGSGHSPIFSASLWLGGRIGGEIRAAGAQYTRFQFWPGPLGAGAALPDPADCTTYDRIWLVSPADVAAYEAGGPATTDLRQWPVGLGAPAVDAQGKPVPAVNPDQRIDLPGGERPVLGGGPTAFWVMNDVGNARFDAGEQPLGVEVRVLAFAPAAGPLAFRQATFYRITAVNRTSAPITDFNLGVFADTDLGNGADDYVGTDTTRGMAFAYNADDDDEGGYGTPPPAFGLDVLSGLYAAPRINKGASAPTEEPHTAAAHYARLRGLFNDGTPMREFGLGYMQTQGAETRFSFTGDPTTRAFWSMPNPENGPLGLNKGDQRLAVSGPPVTLAPGASATLDVGMLFAQGADRLASVRVLRQVSSEVQGAYDAGTLFTGQVATGTVAAPTLVAPAENASFYETPVTFSWDAVPGADSYVLEYSLDAGFSSIDLEPAAGTSVTVPASRFAPNRTEAQFWRVRSVRAGIQGPPSAARAVRIYRYAPDVLRLASGARAYVETTAPGGAPACDGPVDPDEGCAEVGGDTVFESANSTGVYRLINTFGGGDSPGAFGPHTFEIRFTARGSYAFSASGNSLRALFRVPFEVWDIGTVPPGTPDEAADDVQLVPGVSLISLAPFSCTFDFDVADSLLTPRIAAYYPTDNDYAAFAAIAAPIVTAAPNGCAYDGIPAAARAHLDVARGLPLTGFRFERIGPLAVGDLAGTTVRFYTVPRAVGTESVPVADGVLRLGAPFPNPVRGSLTVPVSLDTSGRLRVVDILGRTVLEQPLDAGARDVRLDTQRLAPGVYALVLDAGAARATRTVTVVR